jgi:hypothetical protein
MPTPDATDSASPTIAEILAKLRKDVVKLGLYGILDPGRSWKRSLFQPLRVSIAGRPGAVR